MAPSSFEAVEVGTAVSIPGRHKVTAEGIIGFGERWEPWIHHVDDDAADDSRYVRRLTASTLHLAAVGLRLLHDGLLADSAAVDTVGIERAWREYQVHPGDTLAVQAEATETEVVSDRLGLVTYAVQVRAVGEDVTVMTLDVGVVVHRQAVVEESVDAGE